MSDISHTKKAAINVYFMKIRIYNLLKMDKKNEKALRLNKEG
jgi:hypothetical protein